MATEKIYEWTGINDSDSLRKDVCCFEAEIDHPFWTMFENFTITISFLIILEGSMEIEIDNKTYYIEKDHSLFLTPFHNLKMRTISPDVRCKILLVNKNVMDEIRGIETSFKHVVLILRSHHQPIFQMWDENKKSLLDDFDFIEKRLSQTSHLYQKELIYTALTDLLFDIGDIYGKKEELSLNKANSEYLIRQFTQLLMAHYKSEHEVTFYSSQMNISSQYLSSIIRNVTGQTVGSFIYNMLFEEACNLLKLSQMSVQQIADELHFSDQSAFGKFFKRKSKVSPSEYRRNTK